jgi:sortase A
MPIISWQLFYAPSLSSGNTIIPIPRAILVGHNSIGSVLSDAARGIPLNFDSMRASQWFPTGNPNSGITKEYKLSIPKLGIYDAKVMVGSDDLSKSLIHYGGSSLPGEYGNAVIFGHSVLPQFFDPKNYMTIFSTLHTLKIGDTITIVSDTVTYTYAIFDFKVVDPTDVSVLEQTYDDSYLTIITCTPPGTFWKRLVVRAKVEKT